MDHKQIKVGVVQATPALFNIDQTIAIIEKWIKKAKDENCELLLFPESFIPAYPRGISYDATVGKRTDQSREQWLDYWENSIELPSKHTDIIGKMVKEAAIFTAIGVTEREPIGGSLYCSIAYFNNDGRFLGKHRKLKPTGLERYVWAEGNGDGLVSFDTDLGKIGGLICWENYMPFARMSMYQKGIEIYLAPTADARESWTSSMQHIALEGRCFVLGCNQFVRKSDYPEQYQEELKNEAEIMSQGGSIIVAPDGNILAGPLWNKEGLLTADLDFRTLAKCKLDFDVVGHYSRNDIFSFEAKDQPEINHTK